MKTESRPNTLWPIGTKVEFLDAWGRNPVTGRVIRHIGETDILIEDDALIRYYGQTWRVTTEPPQIAADDWLFDLEPAQAADPFEDLLG